MKIVDEEQKFMAYYWILLRGLYNMEDWRDVIRYAKEHLKIDVSIDDYRELGEHYSELKEKYLEREVNYE